MVLNKNVDVCLLFRVCVILVVRLPKKTSKEEERKQCCISVSSNWFSFFCWNVHSLSKRHEQTKNNWKIKENLWKTIFIMCGAKIDCIWISEFINKNRYEISFVFPSPLALVNIVQPCVPCFPLVIRQEIHNNNISQPFRQARGSCTKQRRLKYIDCTPAAATTSSL